MAHHWGKLQFSNFWPERFLNFFLRNTESASGPVSGAELPGRFQVLLPRAAMLDKSVENASRSGRLIRVRSKALRRSLAS